MNDEKSKQTNFVSHLTELRSRLVKSFVYLFIFFIVCYIFSEHIYAFLVDPYAEAVKDDEIDRRLIFTALHETFITYLKVAFFAAIFIENKQEGIIKISFRSKGDFSVNTFARAHFNGGGHNNAAGGRSEMSMNDTIVEFNKLLPEYKEQLQA